MRKREMVRKQRPPTELSTDIGIGNPLLHFTGLDLSMATDVSTGELGNRDYAAINANGSLLEQRSTSTVGSH